MNRTCSPDDIKRIWSNRMAYQLKFVVSGEEIYEMRIVSERAVCSQHNSEFRYHDMILDLYQRILCANNFEHLELSKEVFSSVGLEEEIRVEKENQLLNEKVINEIKHLKVEKRKVYVLSDFYLDSQWIVAFLKEKGVESLFDGIFVSCELGVNKARGEIYTVIKKELSINARECCMVGDNYHSDILQARKNGFSAIHITSPHMQNRTIDSRKRLLGEVCKEKKAGMSYSNYAFIFYRYVSLLYKELVKENITKVFFFAREGELLKKIFDIYCKILNKKLGLPIIESRYLYVSRQATYAASLQDLGNEDFSVLFNQYPNESINTFLANIGFDSNERKALESSTNLNFDVVIDNLRVSSQFKQLKENAEFVSAYNTKVMRSKSYLHLYLEQNGFMECEKAAVVDVGWKGTIQDNIVKCLENQISTVGYYCGLRKEAYIDERDMKKGLLFSEYPCNSEDCKVWSFDSGFWERLLTASHPSVKGYTKENDQINPLFNEFGSEHNNYKLIRPIQERMLEMVEKISDIVCELPAFDAEIYEIIREINIKTCCNVNKDNMVLKNMLLIGQMENFGIQKTWGEAFYDRFTMSNILLKIKRDFSKIKDPMLVSTVFCNKRMYRLGALCYRIQRGMMRIRDNK